MQQNTNSDEKSTTLHGISKAQVDSLERAFVKQKPTTRELTEEEFRANWTEAPEWLNLVRRTVK